jgi:hypothetical protein
LRHLAAAAAIGKIRPIRALQNIFLAAV